MTPDDVATALAPVQGHRMAKAALEMAVLDAWGRLHGRSFASLLGSTRTAVPAGVAVGVTGSVDELLAAVGGYVDEGYRRVKLKVQPGWDVEPVAAVRGRFGPDLALQVDANGAYRAAPTPRARWRPWTRSACSSSSSPSPRTTWPVTPRSRRRWRRRSASTSP